MLALDDPKWEELRDAYGDGTEVAAVLGELEEPELDSEFWSDLYSRICHQYTVYTSTYAAFRIWSNTHVQCPRSVASIAPPRRSSTCLLVPRRRTGHAVGPPLCVRRRNQERQYAFADCLAIPLTESQFRYVQSALAALHGFIDLAFVIEALDTCFRCPSCETSVAVMESRLNLHHRRPKR